GQSPCKNSIDWERLLSERETTAAALSAALQRLNSLEREAEELRLERLSAEGQGQGELGKIREALRRKLFGARAKPAGAPAGAQGSSDFLLRQRTKDLQRAVQDLRLRGKRRP
ncbi:unnamed protein product, partial [Polarella glacialis]